MNKKTLAYNISFTIVLAGIAVYKLIRGIKHVFFVWLFGFADMSKANEFDMLFFELVMYLAYAAPYIMVILTIIVLWLNSKAKLIMSLIDRYGSGSLLIWDFLCSGYITFAARASGCKEYRGFDPLVSLILLILLFVITNTSFVSFSKKHVESSTQLNNK